MIKKSIPLILFALTLAPAAHAAQLLSTNCVDSDGTELSIPNDFRVPFLSANLEFDGETFTAQPSDKKLPPGATKPQVIFAFGRQKPIPTKNPTSVQKFRTRLFMQSEVGAIFDEQEGGREVKTATTSRSVICTQIFGFSGG